MAIALQESLRAVFYAPFYAALSLDAYGEEGVDVRFKSATSPDVAARGLLEGTVDITWGGPMRVMQTYAREPQCDLVCFCEVVTRDPFMLVGRTARPNFQLQDLAGLRVASVSEVPTPWLCLQEDLRRAGLEPTRLNRSATGTMSENAAALLRGEIDVVQLFEPYVEALVDSGAGHIWYAASTRGPTSYTTFYACRPLLSARRDECERMVRAIFRTQKWLHAATTRQVADAIGGYFPDLPAPRLMKAIDRYKALGIWGRNPRLPLSGYERLRASLVSGGFVTTGTDYATCVDNSFAERVIGQDLPALVR
jgi:NitT/TauT family transport system substrate-binding protein